MKVEDLSQLKKKKNQFMGQFSFQTKLELMNKTGSCSFMLIFISYYLKTQIHVV